MSEEHELQVMDEAKEDLGKSMIQLQVDIHNELQDTKRTYEENLLHGAKRVASMWTKLAISQEESSARMEKSAKQQLIIAYIALAISLLALLYDIFFQAK